jgi:hypothetical protein
VALCGEVTVASVINKLFSDETVRAAMSGIFAAETLMKDV